MRLSPITGDVLLAVPELAGARTVEVDLRRGTVWAYARRTLYAYDFAGHRQLGVPLATSDSVQAAMAVTPADGAVWLGVGHDLLNVGTAGQPLNSLRLAGNVVALEADPVRSLLWVATGSSVDALDLVSGATVRQLDLPGNAPVVAVAVQPAQGGTWVALKDEVRLYGASGDLLLAKAWPGTTQIATDGADGAWVATAKTVTHLSATGAELATATPFDGTAVIGRVVSAGDHTVWVASPSAIAHLSSTGTVLQRLSLQPPMRVRDLAVNSDGVAPAVSLTAPAPGACVADRTPTLEVSVVDTGWGIAPESFEVAVNGILYPVACSVALDRATCDFTSPLPEGLVTVSVTVQDFAGNRSALASTSFMIDVTSPVITVTAPADGAVVSQQEVTIEGSVSEAATLTVAGSPVTLAADRTFSHSVQLSEGANAFELVARDCAGNEGSRSLHLTYQPNTGGLPPDPATVAPPIDQSTVTDFASSVEFLYAGPTPIQTGVQPGAIAATQVAVVRGRVLATDGTPLGGVKVTAHGQLQFGQTLTRQDGMFDLALNGGGVVVLDYEKDGYIAVQRETQTHWREFAWTDEVVMTAFDTAATAVTAASPVAQLARSQPVTDERGTRRGTIVVRPGTGFELEFADGTRRAVDSLTVRATEFTVGPRGRDAMPAALPATTAYTYAVELSADEVRQEGATGVRFSQPVAFYTENFLSFPVGGIVPSGYYDRAAALWVPSDNGRVIAVLGVTADGAASIDVDGHGVAAGAPALAALGVTSAELVALAQAYAPGQTLWRVPVTHFTPFDFNWPLRPPGDSGDPPPPDEQDADEQDPDDPANEQEDNDKPGNDEEEPDCARGSIIECENQTLRESLPIPGTPYRLNYRSPRFAQYRWNLRLSTATVPASLKRIELTVEVGGQQFHRTFGPAPNQQFTFTWDGKDRYGRPVQGQTWAQATVAYVYDQVILIPRNVLEAFGLPPLTETPVSVIWGGVHETSRVATARRLLGSWSPVGQRIGGWGVSGQHVYDAAGRTLYLGSGERQQVGDVRWVVRTVAGKVDFLHPGHRVDGGPAINFDLDEVRSLAVGPDNSVYVGARQSSTQYIVYRVTPSGAMVRVAGGGTSTADGINARDARLTGAFDLAIGKSGVLYIQTDTEIRQVFPDGRIGTLARNLVRPSGIGLSPTGELYLTATGTSPFTSTGAIYHVTPQGKLRLLVGGATAPTDVAADQFGTVYVCDGFSGYIYRLRSSGRYEIITGYGVPDATTGGFTGVCRNMAVAPDGSLLYVDLHEAFTTIGNGLRHLSPSGVLTTIAGGPRIGNRNRTFDAEGGPAIGAEYNQLGHVAVAPDGSVVIAEDADRVYRVTSMMPGFAEASLVLPSASGRELYLFSGRHTETRSALTGGVLSRLDYDARGLLVGITDRGGNTTVIERNAGGAASAFVSPYGERTALSYDADGMLASFTNAADESYTFTYYTGGLLETLTNPRGKTSRFAYALTGRLLTDEDAAGAVKRLTRFIKGARKYRVKVTTGAGRIREHMVERSVGLVTRTTTDGVGLRRVRTTTSTGREQTQLPDGTFMVAVPGADGRFAMASPIAQSFGVSTPGGLSMGGGTSQSVVLNDPSDLMSLRTIDQSFFVNGRTYRSVFDAPTRTFTLKSPEGRQFATTIDAVLKPLVVAVPGLEPVRFLYDGRGRTAAVRRGAGANERVQLLSYDGLGRLRQIDGMLGKSVSFDYDSASRLVAQHLPGGRVISYDYDEAGNMVSIGPPGRPLHRFSYDDVDQASSYTPPQLGTAAGETLYVYDLDRKPWRITRPDGGVIAFGHDAAGRPSWIDTRDGRYEYTYSATSGRLESLSAPGGQSLGLQYDGFLATRMSWSGVVSGVLTRSYDKNFWLTGETVSGGSSIAFTWDRDGLLTRAGDLQLFRSSISGFLTGTALADVTTSHGYNTFGELTSQSAAFAGTGVLQIGYQRDLLGRVTTKTESSPAGTTAYGYDYDEAGRLADVTKDGAPFAHYEYDPNGNRTLVRDPSGEVAAAYDDQDRLTQHGATTRTYTPNGELESKRNGAAEVRYTYDAMGNLQRAVLADGIVVDYVSDGQGRRVGKKINGALVRGWIYRDDLHPVAELDGTGAVVAQFVYTDSSNAPDYMIKGGALYRIVADQVSSVRRVIDVTTGEVVQQLDYDPFGRVLHDSNPGFQPFGFAGGLYDLSTGLVRFGRRDYDPEAGRWTTKDPLLFDGGSANLYGYVLGDPINFIDPTGLTVSCTYDQSSGNLTCTDDTTGDEVVNHDGYAGTGVGRNNPDEQCTRNVGPLPRGEYTIGDAYDSPNTGRLTLPLTPDEDNDMCTPERDAFRIHGDNAANDASEGCIIMPRSVRETIDDAGGGTLTVVR